MSIDYCFGCESHIDLDKDLHEECDMMARKVKTIHKGKFAETLAWALSVSVLIYCGFVLMTN